MSLNKVSEKACGIKLQKDYFILSLPFPLKALSHT
jgi:hypothetical protein